MTTGIRANRPRWSAIALSAALLSVLFVVRAPVASAQTANLDCADFGYQEVAQAFFEGIPDDPFGLDPDDNGTACDELPSIDDADTVPCSAFGYQEFAQVVFESVDDDATDPLGLDPDGNGRACDSLAHVTCSTVPSSAAQALVDGDDTNIFAALDSNDDGVACNEAVTTTTTVAGATTTTVAATTSTTKKAATSGLAKTGSNSPIPEAFAGVLILLIGMTVMAELSGRSTRLRRNGWARTKR